LREWDHFGGDDSLAVRGNQGVGNVAGGRGPRRGDGLAGGQQIGGRAGHRQHAIARAPSGAWLPFEGHRIVAGPGAVEWRAIGVGGPDRDRAGGQVDHADPGVLAAILPAVPQAGAVPRPSIVSVESGASRPSRSLYQASHWYSVPR
jgi:hypothetical protein